MEKILNRDYTETFKVKLALEKLLNGSTGKNNYQEDKVFHDAHKYVSDYLNQLEK